MEISPTIESARPYSLSDDLARLCLPQEYKDTNRKLAWVNSICALFLLIGVVGLKPPKIIVKPLSEPVEIVPVVFTPPQEPPPTQPQPQTDEPPPSFDAPADAPIVATVVAADASAVAFAVPVQGPVILAPAQFAAPPPSKAYEPPKPKPTTFIPSAASGGSYPDPSYPREELLARHQGTVMLNVVVDPDGTPSAVTVKDSSGYPGLDRYATQWIKSRWRWPAGETRYYYVPIVYQIR
jgi:periplasmic protein TonB